MTHATEARPALTHLDSATDRRAAPIADSARRYDALDAARGIAVLVMIAAHLIGTEGGVNALGRGITLLIARSEPTAGALFCVIAGISWTIQVERFGVTPAFRRYFAVRALALGAFGVLFHVLLWQTEILVPFAMMMALSLLVLGRGRRSVAAALLLCVAATVVITRLIGNYAVTDWTMNDEHVAEHTVGWVTARYLFFDGNYPLFSWIAFPLSGMLFWQTAADRASLRRWCLGTIAVALVAQTFALIAAPRFDALAYSARYVATGWTPTSAKFLVTAGSSALVVIAALLWTYRTGSMPRWTQPLVLFGRASLSHYVLHIAIAYSLLRLWYPDEDWPVRVGALAAVSYLAIGVPLTMLWFRRHTHGPLEALWARASRRPALPART